MSKTILILAGDTFEIRSLSMSLEVERFTVERCAKSDDIWQWLEAADHAPVALLVHLAAPWDAMKGVLRQFRASEGGRRAPILILGDPTQAPSDKDMVHRAGVNPEDFFPPPFDGVALVNRLKNIDAEGEAPPAGFGQSANQIRGAKVGAGGPIATPVAAEGAEAEGAPASEVKVEIPASGSLDRMTPAKLIALLLREKATGRVDFRFPKSKGAVHLKEGKVMHFSASGDMGLGAYLKRVGQIDEAQLEGVNGEITVSWLIGKGVVSPHQAFTVLNNHFRYWLRAIAALRKGEFLWLERIGVPPGSFPLDVPIHRTLLDGILQNPPVPHPLPAKLAQAVPEKKAEVDALVDNLALAGLEARAVRMVDGNRRLFMVVQEVAKADGEKQAQLEALLVGLRELGILNFKVVQGRAPRPKIPKRPGAEGEAATAYASLEELQSEMARIKEADAFGVMKVEPDTDPALYRKRFFEMSKRFHPDKYFEADEESRALAEEIFKEIREAYAALTDEQQREALIKMRLAGSEAPITEDDEGRAAIAARQGGLFLRNRNYQQALYFYDKAVELNPLQLDYHFQATWSFFLANPKEVERALSRLHGLLKKEAKHVQGFYYLGCMLKAVPDMEQAKRAFNKVLSLQPSHIEAQRELRLIDMRHKKSQAAKKKSKGRGLFGFRRR